MSALRLSRTATLGLAAGSLWFVALLGSGCTKTETPAASQEAGPSRYSMSEADTRAVAAQFPTAVASPTGLLSIVTKPGDPAVKPRYGSVATVNYSLRLLTGPVIEASPAGEPLRFQVGMGRVIRGWDEALMQMTKGEKRTLIIPHYLAYGVTGSPPKIPPYATLVFEVEVLDFK